MHIAVCDNEKTYIDYFKNNFGEIFKNDEVYYYINIEKLMLDMKNGMKTDILFLDIDLDRKKSGIEYAEEFKAEYPEMMIIYVTAYNDRFSQEIFLRDANLCGYLVKPVREELLLTLLAKAGAKIAERQSGKLAFKVKGNTVSINSSDVVYIESKAHNLNIYTKTEILTISEKLSDFLEKLPDWFMLCHKSYAVNIRLINRITSDAALLDGNITVPISRSKYGAFNKAYLDYMQKILL